MLKLKDNLITSIAGQPTEDQRIDNMIGTLEKRLNVYTGDGTVMISIYWPNAQMARQLVETAQQNFLEARHVLGGLGDLGGDLDSRAPRVGGAVVDRRGGEQHPEGGRRARAAPRRRR